MTAGAARLIPVLCLGVLPAGAQEVTFRANARLVEVHATVLDEKGRYIDDLELADFRVAEDGRQQEIVAFEDLGTELSCALLLDTTGSMAGSLPAAKRGVLLLLDELRGSDAVAVYGFNNSVTRLVDFTLDKSAAKQADASLRPDSPVRRDRRSGARLRQAERQESDCGLYRWGRQRERA
jgi:VWFA-related protein